MIRPVFPPASLARNLALGAITLALAACGSGSGGDAPAAAGPVAPASSTDAAAPGAAPPPGDLPNSAPAPTEAPAPGNAPAPAGQTAPTLAASLPAEQALDVSRIGPFFLYFDQDLDPSTVTAASVSLMNGSTPVAVDLSVTGGRISIQPQSDLSALTAYSLTVSQALRSAAGKPLEAPVSRRFTTGAQSWQNGYTVLGSATMDSTVFVDFARPDFGLLRDGGAVAVWSDHCKVWSATLSSTGSWSGPSRLDASEGPQVSCGISNLAFAVDADGRAVAAWHQNESRPDAPTTSGPRLYSAVRTSVGWAPAEELAATQVLPLDPPSVALDAQGVPSISFIAGERLHVLSQGTGGWSETADLGPALKVWQQRLVQVGDGLGAAWVRATGLSGRDAQELVVSRRSASGTWSAPLVVARNQWARVISLEADQAGRMSLVAANGIVAPIGSFPMAGDVYVTRIGADGNSFIAQRVAGTNGRPPVAWSAALDPRSGRQWVFLTDHLELAPRQYLNQWQRDADATDWTADRSDWLSAAGSDATMKGIASTISPRSDALVVVTAAPLSDSQFTNQVLHYRHLNADSGTWSTPQAFSAPGECAPNSVRLNMDEQGRALLLCSSIASGTFEVRAKRFIP